MEFKDNLRDSLKVVKEIRKLKSEIEAKRIYLDQINTYPYHPIIRVILRRLSDAYIDLEDNKNTEEYHYCYMVLFKQLIVQIMKMNNNDADEKSIIDELFNNQLYFFEICVDNVIFWSRCAASVTAETAHVAHIWTCTSVLSSLCIIIHLSKYFLSTVCKFFLSSF